MKYLYIHGFNSAAYGEKIVLLRETFGAENVLAINLPYQPAKAVKLLDDLVEALKTRGLILVSSSLGSYYALWLTARHYLPAILINPALQPYELLASYTGEIINFKTSETYDFKPAYLDELRSFEVPPASVQTLREQLYIYLDDEDELLDSHTTAEFFSGFRLRIFPGGNHQFAHMKELLADFKAEFPKKAEPGSF